MEQQKIERLLRIIRYLVNNKLTTRELSQKLNCSIRTIQRYIETLKYAGFVIEYRDRGVPYITPKKGALKDISDLVHFSEEEAQILYQAIDSIEGNTTLKQNLKKKLYSIYNFPWLADIIVKPEYSKNIKNLITAIQSKKIVVLKKYRSSSSKKIKDRLVEPFKFTTNYEQIWCYDIEDKTIKTFKVSRIGSVELTNDEWKYENKHKKPLIDVFRFSGEEYIGKVMLKLNVYAYNLLTEEFPLAEKYINQNSDDTFIFEAPVIKYEGAGRFVLGLFENIEILGDDNFKKYIRKRISLMKNKCNF